MTSKGIAARLAATQILHGVLFDKRLMSEMLQGEQGPLVRLGPADRARAQSLATGVLRHLQGLDAVLDAFLEKSPPPKVRNALRLAAFEILSEGTAAHGAVNAAVEIVRGSPKSGHLAGLTNAVARKLAEGGRPIWEAQKPQALPSWLAKPVARHFGTDAVQTIEAAHQAGAAIDLTLKEPAKAAEWAEKLKAQVLPTGSIRLGGRVQVTALEGFDTGDWWVQDAAAALPARLLGDVRELPVLDLCAAPGGKTMQLAAAGAKVTAVDISDMRMHRIRENLNRVRLNANLLVEDVLDWQPAETFAAILLDAPCSATGTIRRHPDLPFVKAGVDMSLLFKMQADMIDAAFAMLAGGGRLVYCTCSLLPREGETQVEQALARHPDMRVMPFDAVGLGVDPDWVTPEGGLRLRPDYWPELGGMDGFYLALLQKS
ncbi:MAG: methyltransferase domain-containing protein [Rhodobacteraceae bacterium]|nr:methyltransferase domain-containing protein [Paracoccaceae bacterium]